MRFLPIFLNSSRTRPVFWNCRCRSSSISIDMTYNRRRLDEAINKMTGGGLKLSNRQQAHGSEGPPSFATRHTWPIVDDAEALENREVQEPPQGAGCG